MKKAYDYNVLIAGGTSKFSIPEKTEILQYSIWFDIEMDMQNAMEKCTDGTYQLVLIMQSETNDQWMEVIEFLHKNRDHDAQYILLTNNTSTGNDQLLREYPYLTDCQDIPQNFGAFKRQIRTYILFLNKIRNYELAIQKEQYKRQLAENESVQSQLLFENIIQKSDAGILLIDDEGIIQFANKAAEEIFLRQSEELVGKPFGLMGPGRENSEIEIVRRSGEIGIGDVSITDTKWKEKEARLVVINDVTRYKKLLKKYEKAQKKAEESDRLKTSFLANMSHEIRTPMNGIVGFAQLMKDNTLEEEDKERYLDIIISSGDHLLTLINDILDIAKIEAGQLNVKFVKCNLTDLMNEVYNIFAINPKIDTNTIHFSMHPHGYDNLFILADVARLKQILINLINNALKFTYEGSIEFGFRVMNEEKKLLFFVKDTGIGIPEKEHRNIFQRFRKLEPDESETQAEGTGIGLAICQSLVQLMGGEIWINSAEGKGATFNFTLPYIETDGDVEKTSDQSFAILDKKGFSNKRLLIVEDSSTNFMLISSVLKHFNVAIYWAKNGKEAVDICKREQIDLVLMDIKLPVLNGFEATKLIKKDKPGLPVIAQTAYAMGSDRDKCLEVGCDDYIEKPFDINALLDKMTHYIE